MLAADITAPTISLVPSPGMVQADGRVSQITVAPSEQVAGLWADDIRFAVNGREVPLEGNWWHGGMNGVGPDFQVTPINPQIQSGTYSIFIRAAGSGIADIAGNPMAADASYTWQVNGADLSGQNFSGKDFAWHDFTGANFAGANLTGVNFHRTNLQNANLTNANLSNADLTYADLSGAVLEGVTLTGARFAAQTVWPVGFNPLNKGMWGPGVDYSGQDFSGRNFSWHDFTGASFAGANLTGVNFHRTNLQNADLTNANLSNADLTYADLSGAVLEGVTLIGARFAAQTVWPVGFNPLNKGMWGPGIDYSGQDFSGRNFSWHDFTGANFAGANLTGASFRGANLRGANLANVNLTNVEFWDADLTGAVLTGATLTGARFATGTVWPAGFNPLDKGMWGPGVDYSGRDLSGKDFSWHDFTGANFTGANLAGASFQGTILRNANLTDANLTSIEFRHADLTGATLTSATFSNSRFATGTVWPAGFNPLNKGMWGPGVDYSGQDLSGRDFAWYDFTGANFAGANLSGSHLRGTTLRNANFINANLTGVEFGDADVIGARYSPLTVWPAGFDPVAAGAILVAGTDVDISTTHGVVVMTGAAGTAIAYRSAIDQFGNSIIAGTFTGTVDFDSGAGVVSLSSAGDNDGFVAKYSPQRTLLWVRRFGGAGDDRVNALAVGNGAEVYFGGRFEATASFDPHVSQLSVASSGGADAVLGSLDAGGSPLWLDRYGDRDFDEVNALAIQPDENVVAVGSFDLTVDFDRGTESQILTADNLNDVFILSLSPTGSYRWVRQFAGSGYQYPRDAAVAADGSIAVTGSFYGTVDFDPGEGQALLTATPGYTSAFLVKLDASGGLSWAGNLVGNLQFGESIAVDSAGAVYASGVAYGTTDFAFGPAVTNKAFAGGRVYIAKYDAAGSYQWARTFTSNSLYGSHLAERALGTVEVDWAGHVYLAGGFSGTIDFDDGSATQMATAAGSEDAYLLKWAGVSGELQAVTTYGGLATDRAYGISLSPSGQLLVTGSFASTADFGTGTPISSLGNTSGFVAALGNQAPSGIVLSAATVAENKPSGTVVGAFSTSDANAGDTFTYSLVAGEGSTDNASFTISGNTLKTAASFNYEAQSSYSIRVRSTDDKGLSTEKVFAIAIADVRASLFWLSSGKIYQGAIDGTDATVVVPAAVSPGGTITNITVDRVSARIYWSELASSPGNSRIYSSDLSGANVQPVYVGTGIGWINYGMVVDGVAGYIFIHSHDPAPVAASGPHYDGKIQRIEISTGTLSLLPPTVWYARLAADPATNSVYYTDVTGFAGGGPSIYQLNGLKRIGYDGTGLESIKIAGDVPTGALTIDATNRLAIYATGEGSQPKRVYVADLFGDSAAVITSTSSAVTGVAYDALANQAYWGDSEGIHRVNMDGTQATLIYSAAQIGTFGNHTSGFAFIEEQPLSPPSGISLSSSTVDENASVGTVVGQLSTIDLNAGDTFTYTLVAGDGSTDNALFSLSGNTLKAITSFDCEAKSSYSIRVRSTDAAGLFVENTFTIRVADVNETPTDVVLSETSIAEHQPAGTVVGLLQTIDPDSGVRIMPLPLPALFTYSFVAGFGDTDNALFQVARDGFRDVDELVTAVSLRAGTYSIRLRSTDGGRLFTEQAFTITVTNVNETPTDMSLSTSSVAENQAVVTVVGALSTSDPDAGDTFTYALVSGDGAADNASFTIVGNTIQTSAVFNFEAKSRYSIRVRSTDFGGLFAEKAFEIAVTDVAELPSAPLFKLPALFSAIEDVASPLQFSFPAITDEDSPQTSTVTVRLMVADGAITAVSAAGVIVGGRPTARTFTGSIAELNDYFAASPSRIRYLSSPDNVAPRTLTATVAETYGDMKLISLVRSRITITPVNDAPTVAAPSSFSFREDTRGSLSWPAAMKAFNDVDSTRLFVTLAVADGEISATGTSLVAVGGSPTARTFTGSAASLNAYFRKLGAISYTPARDNVVSRTLTTTVSDGLLSTSAVSMISITPVNDAPTIAAAATLRAATANAAFEMTYEMLRASLNAADIDGSSLALVISRIDSGTLQRWNGSAWVTMTTGPSVPRAQRTIAAGQIIRWIPPAGMAGLQPAFRVQAWDGLATSATISRILIDLR